VADLKSEEAIALQTSTIEDVKADLTEIKSEQQPLKNQTAELQEEV
jgi:hypothetical protein